MVCFKLKHRFHLKPEISAQLMISGTQTNSSSVWHIPPSLQHAETGEINRTDQALGQSMKTLREVVCMNFNVHVRHGGLYGHMWSLF